MSFPFLNEDERAGADSGFSTFAIGIRNHVAFAGKNVHPLLAARMLVLRRILARFAWL
jgi:hypothetical protein